MTRDELIEIMRDNLNVWYESTVIEGYEDAADAILAKLEQEQKAKDYNPEAILKILGITR